METPSTSSSLPEETTGNGDASETSFTQDAPIFILPMDLMAETFDWLGYGALTALDKTCKGMRHRVAGYVGNARLSASDRTFTNAEGGRGLPRQLNPYTGLIDHPRSRHFAILFPEFGKALKQIGEELEKWATIRTQQPGIIAKLWLSARGVWGDKKDTISPPLWKALYGIARRTLRKKTPMLVHKLLLANELGFLHTLSCWGVDLETRDRHGLTIMHLTCGADQRKRVLAILSAGARLNLGRGAMQRTPLHWAAHHGNEALGRDLMRLGANPYLCQQGIKENEDHTPYAVAFFKENRRFCQVLLDCGLDLNALAITPRSKENWRPFNKRGDDEEVYGCATRVIRWKEVANLPPLCVGGTRIGHLHHAVWGGHVSYARHLLKKNAQVNLSTAFRWKPLQLALIRQSNEGRTKMVKLLLGYGAELGSLDGRYALRRVSCGSWDDPQTEEILFSYLPPGAVELAIWNKLPEALQHICRHPDMPSLSRTKLVMGSDVTFLTMIFRCWDEHTIVRALGTTLDSLGKLAPLKIKHGLPVDREARAERVESPTTVEEERESSASTSSLQQSARKRRKGKEPAEQVR